MSHPLEKGPVDKNLSPLDTAHNHVPEKTRHVDTG
jgi:hypothetical protein